ncbi:MAG: alkaline phosphatase family protein [Pirellulales bacterium]|nr:alkaline phosphatase family protein [Pirellulales bacterium]
MQPTVLIGLDGATYSILDPLMAAGQMPHLQQFLARGVRAELLTTPHPLTPPAWTTLMTGRSPGHHGIFDFLRSEVRAGGAFFTLNNFRDIHCETIWSIVSRQGGSVTSLNFPLMAPPPKVSGSIVPGLLSWRHLRRNIHPVELYDELKGLPGFNPNEISWDFEHEKKAMQILEDEELEPWTQFHIVRERHWFEITRHIMEQHPADLTAVMFDGVDKLQHGCWRFLDPRYFSAQPSAFERRMRELCVQYFHELDGFIGRIVALAGPQARVFIASDHGFGPTETVFRINKWLESQGYLQWADRTAEKPAAGHFVALDWERTIAYAPSGATNGIHIRVAHGPGETGVAANEYHAFREQLIAKLKELRHPETGVPLVRDVLLREQAFPGEAGKSGPDLTLVLFDHGFFSVLDAEPIVWQRPLVAGTHCPEGVFAAAGPGIPRGIAVSQQSILDVAATLLYSLGLPVPSDFEGKVMQAAFEPAQLQAQPIVTGPPTTSPSGTVERVAVDADAEADSDEKILQRLRALGYVE